MEAASHGTPGAPPVELMRMANGLVVHQCLYAAAKLGVADVLADGAKDSTDLAKQLGVNNSALYRVLRALADQGVFEETAPCTFRNNGLSHFLRSSVPGSLRARLIFFGSKFFYAPFQEILYSVETGQSARQKVLGMDAFEYLRKYPEQGRIFDDAMTSMSAALGPAVAAAYDFGQWQSVMDVGGGNGILLASILKAHPGLHSVLADLPHVLERARERGYLGGDLQNRVRMMECDFFREIPSGCRAYVMKSVIHDWEDQKAQQILSNCRRAVPTDGALLLVEWGLEEGNQLSLGKLADVAMLVLTGGKERTAQEYSELFRGAGFRLNRVVPTSSGMVVMESLPV